MSIRSKGSTCKSTPTASASTTRSTAREGAPWLIFSQLADHQPLDVGRPGGGAEEDATASCATTSAATAARRRPTASTRFDMLTADVIALMDALSIKRAHFAGISMGGMTALFLAQRHRRPLRPHHRLRLRAGLDAGLGAAMEGAHRARRREGHGGARRRHHPALVPARVRRHQGAGARQGARHDPHDAATRASPAARRRCPTTTCARGSPASSARRCCIVRHQGRRPSPGMQADQRGGAGREAGASSKAPATSPTSSSRRPSPRRSRIS